MKPEWMARTYDLFRKNCCFFSKEFAVELGVGSIPDWVYSLANVGAVVDDYRTSSGSNSIEGKKKKKKKDKPAGSKNKVKNNSSSTPEWGRPPSRSDSEFSDASSEEKDSNHNADLIDNVMAARVQRAYRSSVVNRRSTHVAT
jgi:hypothetical protein